MFGARDVSLQVYYLILFLEMIKRQSTFVGAPPENTGWDEYLTKLFFSKSYISHVSPERLAIEFQGVEPNALALLVVNSLAYIRCY